MSLTVNAAALIMCLRRLKDWPNTLGLFGGAREEGGVVALQTYAVSWKKEALFEPKQDLPITEPGGGSAERPPM